MTLFLIQKSKGVSAKAEYDVGNKAFSVFKGSTVSENISNSKSFEELNLSLGKELMEL